MTSYVIGHNFAFAPLRKFYFFTDSCVVQRLKLIVSGSILCTAKAVWAEFVASPKSGTPQKGAHRGESELLIPVRFYLEIQRFTTRDSLLF